MSMHSTYCSMCVFVFLSILKRLTISRNPFVDGNVLSIGVGNPSLRQINNTTKSLGICMRYIYVHAYTCASLLIFLYSFIVISTKGLTVHPLDYSTSQTRIGDLRTVFDLKNNKV